MNRSITLSLGRSVAGLYGENQIRARSHEPGPKNDGTKSPIGPWSQSLPLAAHDDARAVTSFGIEHPTSLCCLRRKEHAIQDRIFGSLSSPISFSSFDR